MAAPSALAEISHRVAHRQTHCAPSPIARVRHLSCLLLSLQVGIKLASSDKLAHSLVAVLETTSFGGGGEELVLNAVCAVTNLSFYQRPDNQASAVGVSKAGHRRAAVGLQDPGGAACLGACWVAPCSHLD
jgi:hypothetical protein